MVQGKIHPSFLIQFTTLVIYLAFVCSIVYNYAYFLAFNISLVQIPLTINDIVNSALVWIPAVSIIAASGFIFLLITKRIEQGMTEDEIVQSTSNPARTAWLRELPFKIMEYGSVVGVVIFILLGQHFYNSLSTVFPLFMIFWFWFGKKISDHPRIIERRRVWLQLLIIFAPIIIGFIFVRGYDDAINKISTSNSDSIIYFKNNTSLSAVTLRNLEKGILLRKLNSNVVKFIPWEDIQIIDMQYEEKYYSGLICKWVSKWCSKTSNHDLKLEAEPSIKK